MTIDETHREIIDITTRIIGCGLSIAEKWPSKKGARISWKGQADISTALKNIPYPEKYKTLNEARNYNFKMVDGALMQFMYEFSNNGRELISHRLGFFPSPYLKRYDESPEIYDEEIPFDSEFYDMLDQHTVPVPVRFDFSAKETLFVEIEHPYSHLTLGEYNSCRIPVNSPITPSQFMNFVYEISTIAQFERKERLFPNHPFDIHPQLQILNPELFILIADD